MNYAFPALVLAAALALGTAASAGEHRLGELVISDPWARASAGRAKNGAAYLGIANHGSAADRLLKAASPAAAKASLHTHIMESGIMKMRPVAAIEVVPGKPTVLKPGGLHLMLMGLVAPLREGAAFPLTLTFERAGSVTIEVPVMKAGSMGAGLGHGNMHGEKPHSDGHGRE